MSRPWLRDERTELAAERILDAAERVFTERGVGATEMSHIAQAAGCSRATLYRYFDSRHALQVAYMHRQTHRVVQDIARHLQHLTDPRERLIEAILAALAAVRDDPALAAWFTSADSTHSAELATASPILETLCAAFLGDPSDPDTRLRARWLLRIIVSLLSTPGHDPTDERTMIELFAAPVLSPP
ncbi:DNA-binding transcriptional regulator, AcrR family [Thermomonospora echinospora]|uniref:DNA-binding transcriptional regulator, AcrR family n=1 Tax=Thermomonospora echinospora TaxID=1992 RepID=A0A1H6CN32_9ACTN|nr:TetR/AcrR family transcriptional regulator [Thermomonospora echinospora]SEG73886.1 DNA-binding transcriptional regulator, AcrR family [Thermomonospora echinospora]